MELNFDKKQSVNIDRNRLVSAYRKLFLGNEEGKIVLHDLANIARIARPTSSSNTSDLLYIEGMRNLFCYITSYLENEDREDVKVEDYNPFNVDK